MNNKLLIPIMDSILNTFLTDFRISWNGSQNNYTSIRYMQLFNLKISLFIQRRQIVLLTNIQLDCNKEFIFLINYVS